MLDKIVMLMDTGMSSHLIVMTGLLIGVAGKFAILLITMAVSPKVINLFQSTLMCDLLWTLLELVGTDSE